MRSFQSKIANSAIVPPKRQRPAGQSSTGRWLGKEGRAKLMADEIPQLTKKRVLTRKAHGADVYWST